MKYKLAGVYSDKQDCKTPLPVYLALRQFGDEVVIMLVDSNGKEISSPSIAIINTRHGVMFRSGGVNPDVGLKLDSKGRIKLDELY